MKGRKCLGEDLRDKSTEGSLVIYYNKTTLYFVSQIAKDISVSYFSPLSVMVLDKIKWLFKNPRIFQSAGYLCNASSKTTKAYAGNSKF